MRRSVSTGSLPRRSSERLQTGRRFASTPTSPSPSLSVRRGGPTPPAPTLSPKRARGGRRGALVEVRVPDHELPVRDQGRGIDPADLPYVFDRFWRAPAARGMPGSGLGLSIVRQVAEAHHALVSAELPGDGGTLLRVEFPAS